MKRFLRRMVPCMALLAALALLPALAGRETYLPRQGERRVVRVWVASAVGGGPAWLRGQLAAWEKQHPGVSTYLRYVPVEEAQEEGAVLPDVILFMPGDVADPSSLLLPLTGAEGLREELLRCGRWQGAQYGLPLCWGAWLLAVDGAYDAQPAATPSPTSLLGRAAPDEALPEPGFPLESIRKADVPLQSPGGTGLFTLAMLLEEKPPLPPELGTLTSAQVYEAFRARQCACALLTTGQATAFDALTAAGKGFPCRYMAAEEIVTDQVWLAGLTANAGEDAASLLAYLTGDRAQSALRDQGLFTVRDHLRLYASSWQAQVEIASARALCAVNAFHCREDVSASAWRVWQGQEDMAQALAPLL